jgi:hypothetical protein
LIFSIFAIFVADASGDGLSGTRSGREDKPGNDGSGSFKKDVMEIIPKSADESKENETATTTTRRDLYVGTSENDPIAYHGGAIVSSQPTTVYFIFYGNWSRTSGSDTPAGARILTDFIRGYAPTPRFAINHNYGSSPRFSVRVPLAFSVASAYSVPFASGGRSYVFGSSLTDGNVQNIVSYAISHNVNAWGHFPDPGGLYFVLTSSDVAETSGFCTEYCGWHTYGTVNGVPEIKFAFVGNAARCLNACAAQSVSPNANPGVDAMISVVAHELDEMLTDPDFNEWYDDQGYESADKCAWTWGPVTRLSSPAGAYYNVQFNTPSGIRKFLIQRQWKISVSGTSVTQVGCSMS